MPTVRPGFLTETPRTAFRLGRSDTAALQSAFRTSPAFVDYNDAAVRAAFDTPRELSDTTAAAVLTDGGYMYGAVPRYYAFAPNLADVVVGGHGLPASPYAPNINSPGDGNGLNYSAIPDDTLATLSAVGGGGAGIGNGRTSPSATTAGTVPRRLGEARTLGVGSGNTFRVRVL